MKGTVKFFDEKKGYGFVVSEEGRDAFAHFREINSSQRFKTLQQGQKIKYTEEMTEKGYAAKNIEIDES